MLISLRNARGEYIAKIKVENDHVVENKLEGCYESDLDSFSDGEPIYRLDLIENREILEEFSTEELLNEIRSRVLP